MDPLSFALAHACRNCMLAVGALALLLFGAFRGKASDGPMTEIAVGLLGRRAFSSSCSATRQMASCSTAPSSTTASADFMKVLALLGAIVTLLMGQDFLRPRAHRQIRIPDPDRARHARHADR